jgi:hypothetical protein
MLFWRVNKTKNTNKMFVGDLIEIRNLFKIKEMSVVD